MNGRVERRVHWWIGVATVAVLVVAFAVGLATRRAEALAEDVTFVSMFRNQADSLRIVFRWRAPALTNPRQQPIARYETQLRVNGQVGPQGATLTADQLVDSLWIVYPAFGDTMIVVAQVRSVDVNGHVSTYASSTPVSLVGTPVAPNPPDSVIIDVPVPPPDSVVVIALVDDLRIWPETQTIEVGQWANIEWGYFSLSQLVLCRRERLEDTELGLLLTQQTACDESVLDVDSVVFPDGTRASIADVLANTTVRVERVQ